MHADLLGVDMYIKPEVGNANLLFPVDDGVDPLPLDLSSERKLNEASIEKALGLYVHMKKTYRHRLYTV